MRLSAASETIDATNSAAAVEIKALATDTTPAITDRNSRMGAPIDK
jgi:hypothetical protein